MSKAILSVFAIASLMAVSGSVSAAVDEAAAKALAKSSDCLKCHGVDKDKQGPAIKKIAAKYKGKADAQEKVIKAMTDGQMVKLSDGTEEKHKVIGTKDPKELKNLADWFLSN